MPTTDGHPSILSAFRRDVIALLALLGLLVCWAVYLFLFRDAIALYVSIVVTLAALSRVAWRVYALHQAPPVDEPAPVSKVVPTEAPEAASPKAAAESDGRNWLLERVRYYRGLGFFRQYSDLADKELAQRLKAAQRAKAGSPLAPGDPLADLHLLGHDGDRVWQKRVQDIIGAERQAYARMLSDWADISRGAFSPQNIVEHWATEAGPIEVTFELDGVRRTIWPNYLQGDIDLSILERVNDYVRESGYRFECHARSNGTVYVLVLTPEEKEQLTRERGWQFVDWDARGLTVFD